MLGLPGLPAVMVVVRQLVPGSSGHKITARSAAARMAVPSSSARVPVTLWLSQEATTVTGPSGGSEWTQKS